jgi:signal transduction histidine kinase/ActR/RegA family two-component response regulator
MNSSSSLPTSLQPLRRKLPLLITVLLCAVVGAFGWLAHLELVRVFEGVAQERLEDATRRVAALLDESATMLRRQLRVVADDRAVADYLARPVAATRRAAEGTLSDSARVPSAMPSRAIWTPDCRLMLSVGPIRPRSAAESCPDATDRRGKAAIRSWVRPFSVSHDSVRYEVVAPVLRGDDTLGFVIETRTLTGRLGARTIEGLIGQNATLMVGNGTGPVVWTNLVSPVAAPEIATRGRTVQFTRPDGTRHLGIALEVRNTPWMTWVQIPMAAAVEPERRTMHRLELLGLVCVLFGALGAWMLSTHVTRPLAELTQAADDLAEGNYGRRVSTTRQDEIGQLMWAFNRMASQVEATRKVLNTQAEELEHHFREAQDLAHELELSNQELLESFEEINSARRDTTVAESLLDEVLRRAPVGIAVLDRELRFVRLNPALAQINRAPLEAHYGRRPGEVVPALAELVEPRLRRVLASGETEAGHRSSAALHEGSRMHWLSSYFPVRGADQEITGVGVIVVDTTANHELEAQLLQAQKMEAVGRLAGGVAHDFNNLLTVITSYTTLALETLSVQDPLHGDFTEIHSAALRAAGLTKQLLAFSRKQVMQPEVLHLNEVASNMERMLRRLIGEDVTLTLDLAGDLGEVYADRGQIEQVIMNLAVNARDAMPDGGHLVIETANGHLTSEYSIGELGAPAGEYVTLSVSDTGTGISEETQAHIFEPFFTTKPTGAGTGLGLATVYGIVKQSDGDIRLRSELGGGSTFIIYLPRLRAADGSGGGLQARRSSATGANAGGSETVLLVEDDVALRHLALRVLRRAGYTVLEAQSSREAIALGASHPARIDLLLTDVVMPDLNGRTVAERLTTHRPDLRVLYMSGYTDDDVMRRGISAAQTQFMQKPFLPDELIRRVREALDANAPSVGTVPAADARRVDA